MLTSPFVHPWLAASAIALGAVPIIIHLLNRRRYRRVVWAAMGFLQAAHRHSAKRIRIEQLILLALRILIMVLIAMAVARPLLGRGASAGPGQVSRHRIIVLDDSYSMGMVTGDDERAFDRATAATRRLLETFGRNDGVSLILSGRPARALVERPNIDRRAVAKTLTDCGLSDATTDLAGALDLAANIASESDTPPENRIVYVITDGTAAAWAEPGDDQSHTIGAAAQRLSSQAELVVLDVGPDKRDNVAVTSLTLAEPTLSAEWPATLLAEIANHGSREASNLRLQVLIGDQVVRTETIEPVEPGRTRAVRFRLKPGGAGSRQIGVRIIGSQGDVLPGDNVRRLSIEIRKQTQVLLVDGRPGTDRFGGQAGYLATALAPRTNPADPVLTAPRTIMAGELATEPLSDYAAVALCNVRQPGRQAWDRLARYVRQGGGVMVFVGDQVDVEDYNRFGLAEGSGILPARIVGLTGSEDDREKFVRIRPEELTHPAVSQFDGQPRSGLFLARFFRHVRIGIPEGLDGARAVLSFGNGDCALAARAVDRGRVLMAGFPPTMEWTNLPAKGDFVSLLLGLLAWVVGDPAAERNVVVGEPITQSLTGRDASLPLRVIDPEQRSTSLTVTSRPSPDRASSDRPAPDRVRIRFEATRTAGAYRLMVGPRAIDFSVNLDPSEGDVRRIDATDLRETLGMDFEYTRDIDRALALATAGARREIGRALLWMVAGLLAVEMLLAMWFGHHRE